MRRTALVPVVAAALVAMPGCASRSDDSNHDALDYVTMTRQTTHGVRWQLDAWESREGLCLAIDGPGGPDDAGVLGARGSGACTFSAPTKKNPDNSLWFAGAEPGSPQDAATVSYGPVPPQASRVQVTTGLAVPTVPLPAGHHLPHARIWWALYAPGTASGTPLGEPRAFSASGLPVHLLPY